MKRPILIKFFGGLLNILTCLIATAIILSRQDWFGSSDTYPFIFWTLPLAIGIAISGGTILNIFKPSNFILRLLFIIIIAALISFGWVYFVYLVLGNWINAFSIPIFYLWIGGNFAQLLFLDLLLQKPTEKQKTSKILVSLLALPVTLFVTIVAIFFISFLYSYLTKPEKELYLIPGSFEGKFRVVYGEKCGTNPIYENGRRVMQIPENGLLIIQPEFKAGIVDNEYYLIDKNGNRKKLNELFAYAERKAKSPGVLMGGSGSFTPDGNNSNELQLDIHYTDFTVFNKDTTTIDDRQYSRLENKFDSLTEAVVDCCRKTTGKSEIKRKE